MCCFSAPIKAVADTRIFARGGNGGRQFLVYEMRIDAPTDVAMILPLPVPPKPMEDDLKFLNFEGYPPFFDDLDNGYPKIGVAAAGNKSRGNPPPKLAVVDVGGFEASFVPTVEDFGRLDERFRLPAGTWKDLPEYRDYGFAVFKLKEGRQKIHPMAFDFPRRDPKKLFFPTVHIHDGRVHEEADFDHFLYLQQPTGLPGMLMGWAETKQPAQFFVKVEKSQGVIDPQAHVYRRRLIGTKKNVDTWV